jgi:hypothetical protein
MNTPSRSPNLSILRSKDPAVPDRRTSLLTGLGHKPVPGGRLSVRIPTYKRHPPVDTRVTSYSFDIEIPNGTIRHGMHIVRV